MRRPILAIGFITATLVSTGTVFAQRQRPMSLRERYAAPSIGKARDIDPLDFMRTRPGGIENQNNRRSLTPSDRLYRPHFFDREGPSNSLVRRDLDSRNLLMSRSYLGRRLSSIIGRQDYRPSKDGGLRGDFSWTHDYIEDAVKRGDVSMPEKITFSPDQPAAISSAFTDRLENRLHARGEQEFLAAAANFRIDDLRRARDHVELAVTLLEDEPRVHLADALISLERADYNRAFASLYRALQRAKSLDDLKLDLDAFYPKRAKFQQATDRIAMMTNLAEENSPAELMAACYAWLDGNPTRALAAARRAEEAMPKSEREPITRFREWLEGAEARPSDEGNGASPRIESRASADAD